MEIPKLGFICLEHKTVPKKCYVDLPWKGKRIRMYSDLTGQVLDTWDRAETVRKNIESEIKNHVFDADKYIKAESTKYWALNLLQRFLDDKSGTIAPSYQSHYRRIVSIAKASLRARMCAR